jgi:hypothetical protein
MLTLGAIAASIIGMHTMKSWRKHERHNRNRRGMKTGVLQNKVLHDVISYAADAQQVGRNLPAIKNAVRLLQSRIQDLKRSYFRGEISRAQFDTEIAALHQQVQTELQLPTNPQPFHLINQFNAKIDRLADKIEEGRLPRRLNFRLYKNHPNLNAFYVAGKQRAVERELMDRGWHNPNHPGKGKAWGHDRDSPLFPGNVHSQSNLAQWYRQ